MPRDTKICNMPKSRSDGVDQMNWNLCVLCQMEGDAMLIDPAKTRNKNQPSGYQTTSMNLKALGDVNALPFGIRLDRLDDGNGIENTLRLNTARLHKSCYTACNSRTVLRAQKKRKHDAEPRSPVKSKLWSSFSTPSECDASDEGVCFFCDKIDHQNNLHRSSTQNLDDSVRRMATEMQNSKLLSKLAAGDITAIDALYHKACLTEMHTRYRTFCRQSTPQSFESYQALTAESIALTEIVAHIEEGRHSTQNTALTFKMSDLVKLYSNRLEQLQGCTPAVNRTCLKEKILKAAPELQAHRTCQGKYETVLSYKDDIGDALVEASA